MLLDSNILEMYVGV